MKPELQQIKDIIVGETDKAMTLSEIMETILSYVERETLKGIAANQNKNNALRNSVLLLIDAYMEKSKTLPDGYQTLAILGQLKRDLESNILS